MKNSDALFTKVYVFVHADIEHFVVVVCTQANESKLVNFAINKIKKQRKQIQN